ncbi:hypothetical protein [Aureibacillus halotolerans]|uniref:hypothetical protein n=1 Tax=Aureibacillus halotolerans TaxID=1508390 RepID=UPI00105F7564|nr:hypothetical protein [Aureibacillus halotolerans]
MNTSGDANKEVREFKERNGSGALNVFEVKNSSFIKDLNRQTFDNEGDQDLRHYLIVLVNDLIEVAAFEEPIMTFYSKERLFNCKGGMM